MDRTQKIIDRWGEWLPPDPHGEAVAEFVARGRASIVRPEADEPPMLMFEDGGSMPLPQVRYDGQEPFYSAQRPEMESGDRRSTKFSDVCGSIDRFKSHVAKGPDALTEHRDEIDQLFDDIRYMVGRMYRRQREYTAFADRLREIIAELEAVEIIDRAPADEGLAEIERLLDADAPVDAERLDDLPEQVRGVASRQERRLREHKQAALAVLEAYREVKGPRDWSEDEDGE